VRELPLSLFTVLMVSFMVLLLIAVKYPRGRLDWPYDRATSLRIFFSSLLFLLILFLIYLVNRYVEYPSSATLFKIVVALFFILILAAGVLYPESLRLAPES